MSQWFLSYDGQQQGPFDLAQAQALARRNPSGHCWRQGFGEWLPIRQVSELNHGGGRYGRAAAPPPRAAPMKSTLKSSGPRCSLWKWS